MTINKVLLNYSVSYDRPVFDVVDQSRDDAPCSCNLQRACEVHEQPIATRYEREQKR